MKGIEVMEMYYSDIEAREAIKKFINSPAVFTDNCSLITELYYLRELMKDHLNSSEIQRIMDNNALIIYIENVFSVLLNKLKDDYLNNVKSDILLVEDYTLIHAIKTFIKLIILEEEDVDINDYFNLYFITANNLLAEKAAKHLDPNNVSRLDINNSSSNHIDTDGKFMKNFDAILGNPPYAYINSSNKSQSGRQFWHDFAKWSFERAKPGGLVSLVTPDNWLISDHYENLLVRNKKNLLKTGIVNFEDASVSARYWISTNEEYQGDTNFDGYHVNMTQLPYYPLNGKYVSIFEKILNEDKIRFIRLKEGTNNRNKFFKDAQENQDDEHKYPVYFSNTMIKYSSVQCPLQNTHKILVASNASWNPWYDDGVIGCNQDIWYLKVDNEKEANNILSYLKSNVVSFIMKATRRRRAISKTILKNFPMVNFDKMWTNEKLYDYFELTQDEIDMIEEVVSPSRKSTSKNGNFNEVSNISDEEE